MPPVLFQLVALLIGFFAVATTVFPRQMSDGRREG